MTTYDELIEAKKKHRDEIKDDESATKRADEEIAKTTGEWKRQSVLGRMGQWIEPAVRPLGWDWKIGMAALASFPAREVVVGTLGIIYNEGKVDSDEMNSTAKAAKTGLGQKLRSQYTIPTGAFADGLLRAVLPMRLDAGGDSPRDAELALAGIHFRLHDGAGVCRGAAGLSSGVVDLASIAMNNWQIPLVVMVVLAAGLTSRGGCGVR